MPTKALTKPSLLPARKNHAANRQGSSTNLLPNGGEFATSCTFSKHHFEYKNTYTNLNPNAVLKAGITLLYDLSFDLRAVFSGSKLVAGFGFCLCPLNVVSV